MPTLIALMLLIQYSQHCCRCVFPFCTLGCLQDSVVIGARFVTGAAGRVSTLLSAAVFPFCTLFSCLQDFIVNGASFNIDAAGRASTLLLAAVGSRLHPVQLLAGFYGLAIAPFC